MDSSREDPREPEAPPRAPYPDIPRALWLLLAVILLQGLFAVGADYLGTLIGVELGQGPAGLALANGLAFGAVLWVGWRKTRAPAREVFPLGPFPLRLIPAMAATILGAGILFSEVDNVLRSVLPMPPEVVEAMEGLTGPGIGVWGSFVALVVVAPVTEELLFRGLLLRGFLGHHSTRTAVVASGLLFAFVHLNPWQLFATAVAGMILAWWVVETGSLWPALLGHALNNGVPFAVDRMPWLEIRGFTGGLDGAVEFQPLWFDALGAVLAGWGIAALVRGFARMRKAREADLA